MCYIVHTLIILVACTQLLHFSDAKRSPAIYCGACIAMVDEMNWEIDHVDQKSTIQVGSFRIDSRGNQGLREIPLARSEVHLTELLEDICSRMTNYAESTDDNGNKNYIRTSSRDGRSIATGSNFRISSEVTSQLKFACESLIEEYEDEVLEAFRTSQRDVMEYVCVDTMDVCKSNNVTEFTQTTNAALLAAVQAEADRNTETKDEESRSADDETDDEDESLEPLETRSDL